MDDKHRFIQFMLASGVLRFGQFQTKSGRLSPYFVNTGLYNSGRMMNRLADFYAAALRRDFGEDVDNLYGPAYKGIPLCVAVAMELDRSHYKPVTFTYNRKEAKDHGEGGALVGDLYQQPRRVVVVEDVITAGTSLRESLDVLSGYPNAEVCGLLVSVDRQERVDGTLSALHMAESEHGIRARAIVGLADLIRFLGDDRNRERHGIDRSCLDRVLEYRAEYGAEPAQSR